MSQTTETLGNPSDLLELPVLINVRERGLHYASQLSPVTVIDLLNTSDIVVSYIVTGAIPSERISDSTDTGEDASVSNLAL